MTTNGNHDERRFDRLVDGELTRDEYTELLGSLDQEPDGWRRCALAFLESQAWGQDLRSLRATQSLDESLVQPAQPTPRPAKRWNLYLSMAASFLFAFWLGTFWRDSGTARGPDAPVPNSPTSGLAKGPIKAPAANVTFVVDGQRQETVSNPLLEPRQVDRDFLSGDDVIPPEIVRALERQGQDLRRVRHWFPVQMNDGRWALIPLDEVEIRPRE